jgi:hypothetical protein
MKKVVIAWFCVLGLAVACIPAYANPTSKKITLTCSSSTGDAVSGSVDVILCDSTQCVQSIACPQVTCDSVSISTTTLCSTDTAQVPFKVGAVHVNVCYQQDEDLQPTCTPHPDTVGAGVAITGKGFFTVVGPGTDSDTVTLTVK